MILGLIGFIGAGKGAIADILVKRHGFIKESFANSVKDACSAIFGWNRALLEGDTSESRAWREQSDPWWSEKLNREFSPRLALQLLGTEAGRNVFHSDIWVHTVMRRCEQAPDNHYVITDVRFPNEIHAIQNSGGKIVRVRRGPNPEWYETALMENTTHEDKLWILHDAEKLMKQKYSHVHSSEWAWIGTDYDFLIDNNCDLKELTIRIDNMMRCIYNNDVETIEDTVQ